MAGMTEEIERQWFAVDKSVVDRAEADLVCSAVLTLLRPRMDLVFIDAYSDYHDSLSDDAAEAERWLLAKGASRRRGDPGMAVRLDPTDNDHWAVLLRYAPWSINVDLCAHSDPKPIATLHDCAGSVTAYLTPDEAANLAETVAAVAPVLPLDLLRARMRSERAAARSTRHAERRSRIVKFFRRI